jgi:hypothetical protein
MDCDDGSITEKSAMHQWGKFFVEGGKKIGRSFTIVEDGVQRSAMEKGGFVNLEERDFKVSESLAVTTQPVLTWFSQ